MYTPKEVSTHMTTPAWRDVVVPKHERAVTPGTQKWRAHRKQRRSATKIQSLHRRRAATKRVAAISKERDAIAATKIQSIARRRKGRKRVDAIHRKRTERSQAVTKIQSQLRAKKARKMPKDVPEVILISAD